jgi:hypothetical protein
VTQGIIALAPQAVSTRLAGSHAALMRRARRRFLLPHRRAGSRRRQHEHFQSNCRRRPARKLARLANEAAPETNKANLQDAQRAAEADKRVGNAASTPQRPGCATAC